MHKTKTDKPSDKIKEVELIKIRTIKRKHVEQLLEPLDTTPRQKIEGSFYDGVEFLAYIKAYDAILARRLDNQHLSVIRACQYYMRIHEEAPDFTQAVDAAQEFVRTLPQLFID